MFLFFPGGLAQAASVTYRTRHSNAIATGISTNGGARGSKPTTTASYLRNELVLIDVRVPHYRQLIDDIVASSSRGKQFQFVLLDGKTSGIGQITEVLTASRQFDALHVISHGTQGAVQIGSTWLTLATLHAERETIRTWGSHLSPGADILLYGCNLAATSGGKFVVDTLARMTGAHVAASENLTGRKELGGDWELEYKTAAIETEIPIGTSLQSGWEAVLASPVANNDTASTNQDTPVIINVIANDTDGDGNPLTVIDYTDPPNGSATNNGDGTLTYAPDPAYSGADSFNYKISDGTGGLTHYWGLAGNGTDSVGTANGTLYNGPTTIPGHYGQALDFDEINDYVRIPDFTYSAGFTLSFRFKVDSNTGSLYQYLYSHGINQTQNSINVLLGESGSPASDRDILRTRILDGNDSEASTVPLDVNIGSGFGGLNLIGDGQWHSYTLRVSTSPFTGGPRVYIDGVLQASGPSDQGSGGINPAGDLYLGVRNDFIPDRYYGGGLDSVMVFNRSLTPTEVSTLHTTGLLADMASATVNVTVGSDTTPPAAITNLATGSATSSTVDLTWTAPGDDGTTGTAAGYDIRYSTSPITDANWGSATQVTGEPSPQAAGSAESFTVTGLSASTTYYFAIRTSDEVPNVSQLSNVPSGATTAALFCGSNLVMVTADGAFGQGQDSATRTLFESWGYTVTAIDDDASAAAFVSAAAANDVMFISETVVSTSVGTKARDLDIGIVVEEPQLVDDMEFVPVANETNAFNTTINITNNTHYITSPFSTGALTVFTQNTNMVGINATPASGGVRLANTPIGHLAILAFDTGATLDNGSPAANRRVSFQFVIGSNRADWNDNLRTLLERSLGWSSCGAAPSVADLALTKVDNPDPAASGGDLLYTLLITNNGPGTATGVTVTDILPPGVTLQSATPSQGSCSGTTTVTCDLGAILSAGTASIEILVVTSGSGTITNNASVTANESDPVPGNNTATTDTDVVVGGTTDIPLTQYRRIHSFVDSTVTGGSLRTGSNNTGPCNVGASSTGALSGIPASATVVGAYLYWAGSGTTVDSQVTLDGSSLSADRTFQAQFVLGSTDYDFFGGFKDVTAQVEAKRNGNYTFSDLTVATGNPYCSAQAVLAGWSLIVIYQDSSVSGKTLVLYDGFDLERNGSTSYLLSGIYASSPPEAKATFLLWEGDSTLGDTNEKLEFNATMLSDGLNPANNVYNSTINTLGVTTSYGVDLDTFDVSGTIAAHDTLASTTVSVGPDLVILNAVLLQVKSNIITGRVFEDVNYGGGAGRDFATAVAGAPGFSVPRPGAAVELYDSTGTLLRTTTTDANGEYGFAGLIDGDYTVRVPNDNVTSSRSGATGNEKAVQTFRTDGSSGSTVAVTNEVGGADPALPDSPANTTSQNLGTFFAQSKAPAKIITGIAVTNVDFGFNFDTIVNTNNSGQGSLRQFIANANALGNAGLAIQGQTPGKDVSIFMIGDGQAHPGLRAGLANLLSASGVAVITPATVLPAISAADTTLDGTTQTANVGNTNAVLLGAGGTVGVDGLALNRVAGPEVEIRGTGTLANGVQIQANNATIRGLAIYGFGTAAGEAGIRIDDTFTGALIENNVVGSTATSFSDPGSGSRNYYGIDSEGADGGVIQNNLIGFSRVRGIVLTNGSNNWTVNGNEIRDSGLENADGDGIDIDASATNTVTGNLCTGSSSQGIVVTVAGATGNVFTNNTVTGNGVGIPSSLVQSAGITMRSGATSTVLDRNVVTANYGAGVQVNNGATGIRMTRNSVFANGTITARNGGAPTGQIGIDLNSPTDDLDLGTSPFYTPNDSGDTDTGGNDLLNFPILSTATVDGGNLILTGFARPGSTIELFLAESPADGSGFGEGKTYLTTLVEGSAADLDNTTGTYGPAAINGIAQGTDTTNRFRFVIPLPGGAGIGSLLTSTATIGGATSEFSGNVTITGASHQPDAMIKLASEGAGGYLTDDLYEATASAQSKSQGVVSGSTATYNVLFQNDGNVTDNLVITGTGSGSGFTVQYLDNTSTDRTGTVTGAGYTVSGMAVGASTMWTVNVTPSGAPTPVNGGTSYTVFVTLVSGTDNTKIDQVNSVTSSTSANLTLLKSADKGTAAPGEDITYTVNASNGLGLTAADNVVITDPLDANTGYKIGSASFNAGSSGLTGATAAFSDTAAPGPYVYDYTPVDQGCSAPAGYDDCVTSVRWTTTGSMPMGTSFSVGLVVRVK